MAFRPCRADVRRSNGRRPLPGALVASALGLALLWLSGCQSPMPEVDGQPSATAQTSASPERLRSGGSPGAAGLAEAERLAEARLWAQVLDSLQRLHPQRLTAAERQRSHELALAAHLGLDDLEEANAAFAQLRPAPASIRSLELVSDFCERSGRPACAVAALDELRRHVSDRQALNERLWRLTAEASPSRAASLAAAGPLATTWSLRAAMNEAFSVFAKAERLDAWLRQWPGHPLAAPLPRSLALLRRRPPPPHRVGLFVPLSGVLAPAGKALRDGFFSAYLHDSATTKPQVRLYDTAAETMPALHRRSLEDGVTFIIGPLDRLALRSLHRLGPQVPVLGLNYLAKKPQPHSVGNATEPAGRPAAAANGFRTLGLAIEDEAATINRRLLADGHERVLVVRNSEEWARRAAAVLAESWPRHLEQQAFANIPAITNAVGEAMQVAASQARREALEQLLGTSLEFLPRARLDIDCVVAFVDHLEAQALAPAIKFHFAEELPVYSGSQSARQALRFDDMEQFRILETPFRLLDSPLKEVLNQAFDLNSGNLASLFALGLDAYRLFDHWALLPSLESLRGATGRLTFAAGGRIQRQLSWGVVMDGRLRPEPSR